jgi:hypothetical protein
MIYLLIVSCEVGFWVAVVLGLTTRYVLRLRRLSTAVLLCIPLLDLALFVATVLDLRGGLKAGPQHAIAICYLAVTLVWGHRIVDRADRSFARRFGGTPATERPPGHAYRPLPANVQLAWDRLRRNLVAMSICVALEVTAIVVVGEWSRTHWLLLPVGLWTAYTLYHLVPLLKARRDPTPPDPVVRMAPAGRSEPAGRHRG